jgi:Transposase DDE domain
MKRSWKSGRNSYRHMLAGALKQILPASLFSPPEGRSDPARRWVGLLLGYVALLMAWDGGPSLADRFDAARAAVIEMFPSLRRVGDTYQGFIKTLALSGAGMLDRIHGHLRRQVVQMDGCWLQMGVLAFAVDGSRVECPRTAANQKELGCAGKKKTGPQLSLTTIYHMGSGCPWDYRMGPGTDSERIHLRAMISPLPPQAFLVADAGFIGYDLLRDILASGRHVLFRAGSNVTLLKDLGYAQVQEDSTVYLWTSKAQKSNNRPLVLRLIVLGSGRHPVYLVTDVLNEQALPLESAGVLYRMRWGIEVFYRSLKQTLRHRKMRSGAPAQAKMELSWAVTGLWVLSLLGAQAIVSRGKNPVSLSVAMALRAVRQTMTGRADRRRDLRSRLSAAVKDSYVRKGSKSARDWPHKKTERPPGPPKIQQAKTGQIQQAKELLERKLAA